MRAWGLALAALLILAAALLPGPGLAAPAEDAAPLDPGALTRVALSDVPAEYRFTPVANGAYGVYLFPESENLQVHAALWQGDALLAESDATPLSFSLRLSAGTTYILTLAGQGSVRLEIAREALSRSFSDPMPLEDEYAKVLARPGDAHWYSVGADSGQSLLALAVPRQPGLRLEAMLFSAGGRLLDVALATQGGACLMGFSPQAGQRYLIRLRAAELPMTGLYELRLNRMAPGDAPEAIALSPASLTLQGRQTVRLAARSTPSDAAGVLYWESSAPDVAYVSQTGEVTGLGAGTATLTAYSAGGISAQCQVTVEDVPVSEVRMVSEAMELNVGDEIALQVTLFPENALNLEVAWHATQSGVVEIENGVLYAAAEGETTVVARSLSSGVGGAMRVKVGPAVRHYRALLIGEQDYAATVAESRSGTAQTLAGLRGMLESQSYGGTVFRPVRTLLDPSRDEILAALRQTFRKARDVDLSLVYLSCHGSYAGGMTLFRLVDGSVLTAAELARALGDVPGEVVILLDCCNSGGAIGASSGPEDILAGIGSAFDGASGGAPLARSRFHVLASASLEQDSYRIMIDREDGTRTASTLFARALCEAGGWDLAANARGPLRADRDYDGTVTLAELYGYLARRVSWILNQAGGADAPAQTVRQWPEADALTVLARSGG